MIKNTYDEYSEVCEMITQTDVSTVHLAIVDTSLARPATLVIVHVEIPPNALTLDSCILESINNIEHTDVLITVLVSKLDNT